MVMGGEDDLPWEVGGLEWMVEEEAMRSAERLLG
jgi:hypothetical protein